MKGKKKIKFNGNKEGVRKKNKECEKGGGEESRE